MSGRVTGLKLVKNGTEITGVLYVREIKELIMLRQVLYDYFCKYENQVTASF